MNFKRTQTWPGKTHSIIQRSAWGPKSLCIYINQCIVNFNWPMSCARAFLRNNWLPHFRLLLSSPSPSIQNMMTRAMIHPHFKIDEKWILTFLYIYRWNIDLKEKISVTVTLCQKLIEADPIIQITFIMVILNPIVIFDVNCQPHNHHHLYKIFIRRSPRLSTPPSFYPQEITPSPLRP